MMTRPESVIAIAVLVAAFASVGTAANAAQSPITFTYVGDSTTAGGPTAPRAWLQQWRYPDEVSTGGVAIHGYSSAEILPLVRPNHSDVLVVSIGINDFQRPGVDRLKKLEANVAEIVSTVGARRVLVLALAPSDATNWTSHGLSQNLRLAQNAANRALRTEAARNGWTFVDPFAPIRAASGGYIASVWSSDRIHPTPAGYAIEAGIIHRAILRMAAGPLQ